MPTVLAVILTFIFMWWLFRRDKHQKLDVTRAVWIPFWWFMIMATRAVSSWLALFGINVAGKSLEDGSPVDAVVYFILIAAGARVLSRRLVKLDVVIQKNAWLALYIAYCFVAIFWSEFPFVSLKRWVKDLGNPIMILVLLTEPNPRVAITAFFKRCSYIIVPVSVLFIKYIPEFGRGFNEWNGVGFNTGITENKNALGWDCLILAAFFVWHILSTLQEEQTKKRRNELVLSSFFLAGIFWLLSIADSKTPLLSLFVTIVLLIYTGRKSSQKFISAKVFSTIIIALLLDFTFDLYGTMLSLLGRDRTLTTRTDLWDLLLKWPINPILGTGYQSFWLGERRLRIWQILKWNAVVAHNGYLETYINLGVLGLLLMFGILASAYRKARLAFLNDSTGFARFRFAFFFAVLLYNWTETSLGGLHPVWFVFLLIAMEYPAAKPAEVWQQFRTRSTTQARSMTPVRIGVR